jgi:hypothetical protein
MIQATPDTIAGILSAAAGGFTVELSGKFSKLVLANKYTLPIRIIAERALVSGLVFTGAGIDWVGGQVEAFGGSNGFAADGYAVHCKSGSSNVSLTRLIVRNADRGFVLDKANRIDMIDGDVSVRQDGMIINGGEDLRIIGNRFHGFYPKPTTCTLIDGSTLPGLSKAACEAQGGVWKDGDHSDAIQLRNGIKRCLVAHNTIENTQQGIGQMDATSDLPMDSIVLVGNKVEVSGFHSITFGRTTNLIVMRNTTRQTTGRRSPLRVPADAVLIENTVMSP